MAKKYITETSDAPIIKVETPEVEIKKRILRKINPQKLFIIILIIIAIGGVSGSFYFYNKYKILSTDATAEAKKETERLISILGKLIELPKDEMPTVATISDKEKLKDQSFFKTAENGDILFAYTTAMEAILYRPSINKIINVAPISINQSQNITQGTTKPEPNVSTTKKP